MGMTERRAPPARPGLWRAAAPIAPIALLLCAGAAHAAGTEPALACEPGPQARAATTPAQLQAALPDELVRLPQCQDDSAWLAWAGWALNQLGRYTEAAQYLERALLLEPSPWATQMEYAIALAGSGDGLAAVELMHSLRQQAQLPPQLRQAISQQLARWSAAPLQAGWRQHWQLSARAGYDSNLLGAPDIASLTLTLPGYSVQLPLDVSYARQGGSYGRTELGWSAERGPWQLAASAGGRAGANHQAGLAHAQWSVQYQGESHYAGASIGRLHSNAGTRFGVAGLSAGWQLPRWRAGCASRLGGEWQQRRLYSNPVLSGHYGGLLLQHTCEASPTQGPQPLGLQAWQAGLRWGVDQPEDPDRAGGRQQQASLRLIAVGHGAGARQQWLLDAEAYAQADARGYNSLLQNNARRHIQRLALRAEYSWPLAAQARRGWHMALGLEWQRQHSSIVLFQQKSRGAYLALRTAW